MEFDIFEMPEEEGKDKSSALDEEKSPDDVEMAPEKEVKKVPPPTADELQWAWKVRSFNSSSLRDSNDDGCSRSWRPQGGRSFCRFFDYSLKHNSQICAVHATVS